MKQVFVIVRNGTVVPRFYTTLQPLHKHLAYKLQDSPLLEQLGTYKAFLAHFKESGTLTLRNEGTTIRVSRLMRWDMPEANLFE